MDINLTLIRKLTLSGSVASGRPGFLCAASGLVRVENNFYVVADDELSLGKFPATGDEHGEMFSLFPGELPLSHAERKKHKPDLEALTHLSEEHVPTFGAILAMPSGSKANRLLGALIPLQKNGELRPDPQTIDFGILYKKLLLTLPDLNIEGAVVLGDKLKLFQRGNARSGKNAVIDLSLSGLLEDLRNNLQPSDRHIETVTHFSLGELRGTPLSFTDAAVCMGKEIWFLAAAEKTVSTYLDGEYRGAVIGRIEQNGRIREVHELNCPQKPEGLWFGPDPCREFVVVTDADDSSSPSMLYRGKIGP